MITVKYAGRLGNNLVQYAAAYVLAKKTGLKLKTVPNIKYGNTFLYKTSSSDLTYIEVDFGDVFKIEPLNGFENEKIIKLNEVEYFKCLDDQKPSTGYHLTGYFQHEKLLVNYRKEILNLYKLPELSFSPNVNDAFISCRLGDTLFKNKVSKGDGRRYCSVNYIEKELISFRELYDNVYITSDTINHPPLTELIKKYDLTIYQNDPINTILFATQFDNLILSAGSFSYWMAYLGKANNITVYNQNLDPLQKQNAWLYNKNIKFKK